MYQKVPYMTCFGARCNERYVVVVSGDQTDAEALGRDVWTSDRTGPLHHLLRWMGYVSYSSGITAYTGSSLVDTVRSAGIPSTIRTYRLCGNVSDIPDIHNEHTGTSDGLIFTSSCTSTTGIGNNGGGVTLGINHNKLRWNSSAMSRVHTWLSAS